jgi:hypothetical protein
MRNWKLFEPRKPPIVIDFYGWMEDPLVKAAQRADIGWVPVVWTRPYLELPPEPSPVPFRQSLLCSAIMDVILNRPLLIRPYYQDTSFNIADYISEPNSLKRFFELWGDYIRDTDAV